MWSRCVPLCVPLAFPTKNLRIVLSQLNEHLNLNNLLSPLESAYRPSYSNETALLGTFVLKDLLTAQQDLHSNTVRSISCVWYFRLEITFSWLDCTTCLVFLVQHFSLFCPISLQQNTGRHHKWATIAANLSLSLFCAPQGSFLGPGHFVLYTHPTTFRLSKKAHSQLPCIFRWHSTVQNSPGNRKYSENLYTSWINTNFTFTTAKLKPRFVNSHRMSVNTAGPNATTQKEL